MKVFDFKKEPLFIVDNVHYVDIDRSREDFLSILGAYHSCGMPVIIFCNPIFHPTEQRIKEFKTEDDVIEYQYSFFGNGFEVRLIVNVNDDFDKYKFEEQYFKSYTVVNPSVEALS